MLAPGLDTVSQCSGTERMSDWRRILRTEDFKFLRSLGYCEPHPVYGDLCKLLCSLASQSCAALV